MQLRRYIYTNDIEQDYDYVRLARKCDSLSYDTDFLNPNIDVYQGLRTPFEEIRFARPDEVMDPEWKHLLEDQQPTEQSFEKYLLGLKNALKRYFKEVWDPKENYLMFHSGGYDSRILSASLAECRDEGLDCSNIHFRCFPTECGIFKQVMRCERWPGSQYSCFSNKGKNFFSIGHKDHSVNGWASYAQQMNFWKDLGTDWTVIHGWGGEIFHFYIRYRTPPLVHCDNRLLNSALHRMLGREWEGQWKGIFNDVLSPYFSYYYLNEAIRAKGKWIILNKKDWHIDSIRKSLVKVFRYPINKIGYSGHNYRWGLIEKIKEQIENDYYTSRFYKDYGHKTRDLRLFGEKMYMWDGRTWGFMTVYDKIFNNVCSNNL